MSAERKREGGSSTAAHICYIERSRVRAIVGGVADEYVHITEGLLSDIDSLPIRTMADIEQVRSALKHCRDFFEANKRPAYVAMCADAIAAVDAAPNGAAQGSQKVQALVDSGISENSESVTMTMRRHMRELEWLGRQCEPMWGGHLDRGQPVNDAMMQHWIEIGVIAVVDKPCNGYVLTEKGRQYIEQMAEPK